MIKGFFFDLDGTLADTHAANFEAYRRALLDIHIAITFEDFKKTIGQQAQTFLPLLAPGLSKEEYAAIAARKATYYKNLVHLSVLNVHLLRLIHSLQSELTIALVTTAKRKNAEAVLRHHGIADIFDVIVTADDVETSKPSPECYHLALRTAGLKPSEVIAFEDSETGIKAAETAGIAVVVIRDFVP